eukprot:1152973-Pelagomonas_calceolata.AAC.3
MSPYVRQKPHAFSKGYFQKRMLQSQCGPWLGHTGSADQHAKQRMANVTHACEVKKLRNARSVTQNRGNVMYVQKRHIYKAYKG